MSCLHGALQSVEESYASTDSINILPDGHLLPTGANIFRPSTAFVEVLLAMLQLQNDCFFFPQSPILRDLSTVLNTRRTDLLCQSHSGENIQGCRSASCRFDQGKATLFVPYCPCGILKSSSLVCHDNVSEPFGSSAWGAVGYIESGPDQLANEAGTL